MSEKNLRITIKLKNDTVCAFSTKNDNVRFVDFDTEKLTVYFFDKQSKTFKYEDINDFSLNVSKKYRVKKCKI